MLAACKPSSSSSSPKAATWVEAAINGSVMLFKLLPIFQAVGCLQAIQQLHIPQSSNLSGSSIRRECDAF
jgi:hypothetical protein